MPSVMDGRSATDHTSSDDVQDFERYRADSLRFGIKRWRGKGRCADRELRPSTTGNKRASPQKLNDSVYLIAIALISCLQF